MQSQGWVHIHPQFEEGSDHVINLSVNNDYILDLRALEADVEIFINSHDDFQDNDYEVIAHEM